MHILFSNKKNRYQNEKKIFNEVIRLDYIITLTHKMHISIKSFFFFK